MMRPASLIICSLCLSLAQASAEPVPLPLPPPDCRLSLRAEEIDMQSFIGTILRLEGCLQLAADPVADFQTQPDVLSTASLQLIHRFDREAAIRLFVYSEEGSTSFSADSLNALIAECLRSLPTGFSGSVLSPFRLGRNSGPSMIGFVSSEASLLIRQLSRDGGFNEHIVRLCAAPVENSNRILITTLSCEASLFDALNPAFEDFIRSLFGLEN